MKETLDRVHVFEQILGCAREFRSIESLSQLQLGRLQLVLTSSSNRVEIMYKNI
jgi:hypothetical protein